MALTSGSEYRPEIPDVTPGWATILGKRPMWTAIWSISLVGVLPLAAFFAIGRLESSLVLPHPSVNASLRDVFNNIVLTGGGDRGILEDAIFLSYFVAFPVLLLLMYPCYQALRYAMKDAHLYMVIRAGDDSAAGGLTVEQADGLFGYIGKLCRGDNAALGDEERKALAVLGVKDRRPVFKLLYPASVLGTMVFWLNGYRQHSDPLSAYSFHIWADACGSHNMGLWGRTVYEGILYVGLLPLVATCLFRLLNAVHRLVKVLEKHDAIRYTPYPADDAGHMKAFGNVCLWLMALLLPFLLPLLAYVFTYPVTPQLIIGGVVGVLVFPAVFFLPLLGVHRAMVRLRDNELAFLSKTLGAQYLQAREELPGVNLAHEDSKALTTLDILEKSRGLFEFVFNVNTWPYRRRLVATIITASTVLASSVLSKVYAFFGGGG